MYSNCTSIKKTKKKGKAHYSPPFLNNLVLKALGGAEQGREETRWPQPGFQNTRTLHEEELLGKENQSPRKLRTASIQQGDLAWHEKSEPEQNEEGSTKHEREVRLSGLRQGQKGSPVKGY